MTINLFSAIRALVHDSTVAPKAIAEEAGIRYGYLMGAADEQRDDVQFQVRWVGPVTRAAKNYVLIKALAAECGGVFYLLDRSASMDSETAKSLREFGEYLSAVADAQTDRRVTPDEFHRAKAQAHECIAAILEHVESLRIGAGVEDVRK